MTVMFNRVTIIGVGLIGGSIARAMKKHQLCNDIVGYARRENEVKKAVALGVIDRYESSVAEAVNGADLVIVAVPMGAFESMFRQMIGAISPDTVITDVGSAKSSVVNAAKNVFGVLPPGLVPAHPIAGTEKSGVEASFDSLFENRCTIVTPTAVSSESAISVVSNFWRAIGAEVVSMTPEHHDLVLAATSHLPHVLAFSLVDTLSHMQEHSEIFRFAAGGFRDFTRIASSDPTMWRDICLNNKDAILTSLKKYEDQLKKLEEAIANQDGVTIEKIFNNAKNARDTHVIGG